MMSMTLEKIVSRHINLYLGDLNRPTEKQARILNNLWRKVVEKRESPNSIRGSLIQPAIRKVDSEIFRPLLADYRTSDPILRGKIYWLLGELGGEAEADFLISEFRSEIAEPKRTIITVIVQIGGTKVTNFLKEIVGCIYSVYSEEQQILATERLKDLVLISLGKKEINPAKEILSFFEKTEKDLQKITGYPELLRQISTARYFIDAELKKITSQEIPIIYREGPGC